MPSSSPAPDRVLIVEDDPVLADRFLIDLGDLRASICHTGKAAMARLADGTTPLPDAIILDINLPDMNGLDILRHVRAEDMPCAVVVVTAQGSINTAVEAMRAGANDFLVKPFTPERLQVTLRNVMQTQRLTREVETLRDELDVGSGKGFHGFIGASPVMRGVYRTIEAAAPSKATVFITGESGTGKEVCAEAIHRAGPRARGPFVAVNCAAIPKDLLESELFGHVKGAFTGATSTREGAASRADGGTLFLDEIGELDLNLQSKLLRFLQTGAVQKVGGDGTEKVDIRVVCATNRDPLVEVEEGRFREDLYYRLYVIPIHLPPLRDRPGDALELARALLLRLAGEEGKAFTRLSPDAEAAIADYPWPGNVRQLENVLRNAVVLNDGEALDIGMLPAPLNGQGSGIAAPLPSARPAADGPAAPAANGAAPASAVRPLWLVEKDAIEQAIDRCDGNIPKAAALLEISPSTIYRKKAGWEDAAS
jgi:two-component system repressor protein LuxO